MFEFVKRFFRRFEKNEMIRLNSGDAAKERLHVVLMQDRANVSADFLDLMKQDIIDDVKKYVEVDEKEIDLRLTNQIKNDGSNGTPALYANIPISGIKNEANFVDSSKKIVNNIENNIQFNSPSTNENEITAKEQKSKSSDVKKTVKEEPLKIPTSEKEDVAIKKKTTSKKAALKEEKIVKEDKSTLKVSKDTRASTKSVDLKEPAKKSTKKTNGIDA